jgi:hypothetical protein
MQRIYIYIYIKKRKNKNEIKKKVRELILGEAKYTKKLTRGIF